MPGWLKTKIMPPYYANYLSNKLSVCLAVCDTLHICSLDFSFLLIL